MKKVLFAICWLFYTASFAQEEVASSAWKHGLTGAANLTQVALKDWAQGGEDALAWTLTLNGKSTYARGKIDWNNTYQFAFGQSKLGDQDIRKTDDKIALGTTLTYKVGTLINPYVGATLKTQFARGYDYGGAEPVGISQFIDPAYLTQSAGVGYQPREEVKTRLGLAMREIITNEFNSFTDDPETAKVETSRFDGGLEGVIETEWPLNEITLFNSKWEVFAPLTALDETAVNLDNTLLIKAGKYVTVNLNLQIIDDVTASEKTQIKRAIAVGLSYAFIE